MIIGPVSQKNGEVANTAAAPSTRTRFSADYARQAAVDDSVRQKERAQNNREAMRRQAMSDIQKQITDYALKEAMEQERVQERRNMEAGVDKMVRTVVRKESDNQGEVRPESTHRQSSEQTQNVQQSQESDSQTRSTRDKVNKAYNAFVKESARDEELRPSHSELQQKRAVERYQDSTQNGIDRTVELVV